MGKIDSGEIGEVDPHTDSANSLLLIKYATESQSIRFPPLRGEAAENVRKKCIAPSLRPQPSFGHLKVFGDFFPLFCLFAELFALMAKGIPSGRRLNVEWK